MKFPLDEVLTISTGKMLSNRHMDSVYELCNFMTGDNLFTHQLPRAFGVCSLWLIQCFPALNLAEQRKHEIADRVNAGESPVQVCRQWVDEQRKYLPDFFEVPALPVGIWESKDPIAEAKELFGNKVIVATPSPSTEGTT